MKLNTFLLIGLIFFLNYSQCINATTIEELDGKICAQVFYGPLKYNSPQYNYGGTFAVRDGNLYIDNFFGDYSVPCQIENNQLTIQCGTFQPNVNQTPITLNVASYNYCTNMYYDSWGYYDVAAVCFDTASETTLKFQEFGHDEQLDCDYFRYAPARYMGGMISFGDSKSKYPFLFDDLYLYIVEPNAYASAYRGGDVVENYPVRVSDADSNLEIRNFMNRGINYKSTISGSNLSSLDIFWTNFTVNEDNTCFINMSNLQSYTVLNQLGS